MSSKSETGHTKNISGLKDMISMANKFGSDYEPSNDDITIAKLQILVATAQGWMDDVLNAKIAYDDVTNEREVAFRPLGKLATRILRALIACQAPQEKIDDANSMVIKMQGRRAKSIDKPAKDSDKTDKGGDKPATPEDAKEEEEVKHNSVSQQSFDKKIEHFEKLIGTAGTEPKYKPNEANLKLSNLNDVLNDLKAKNQAALNVTNDLKFARMNRDKCLYTEKTGLVDKALVVKSYVISLYNANSSEYKLVRGIKFTKPKKK